MPLELEEIKKMHDKAYNSGDVTRERAAEDLIFYWITHWDGDLLQNTDLTVRFEFDMLRKGGRHIMGKLLENPIQPDFHPIDDEQEDDSEFIDGIYRTSDLQNDSVESYEVAGNDAIVCGFGAWEFYTDYETLSAQNNNQVIKRRAIHEANNVVFWDPNAKKIDKSDANYVSILSAYSLDGYRDLVHELTGQDRESITPDNFKDPEHSYTFPWISGEGEKYYVADFYHREKIKVKMITLADPFGDTITLDEREFEPNIDQYLDEGFTVESEREIEKYRITKYIASGNQRLKYDEIPCDHIPVVPLYGARTIIEGEEYYEGMVRAAKDPQRLRDFQLSYLTDFFSRSPRPKPIFTPEQISGHEDMYDVTGPDNNLPYYLQNLYDGQGEQLPLGPVAMMPEQQVPQSLILSIETAQKAIDDLTNPGMPQDIADPDLSGKAVRALERRFDQQSIMYQQHMKYAKKRDAEIFVSMAKHVIDTPRKMTFTEKDGKKREVEVMAQEISPETGELITTNDPTRGTYEVYVTIGSTYVTQKEQTIEQLQQMLALTPPGTPEFQMIQLKILELMDGVNFDDIRDYARKQLILLGIRAPESDEEKEMVQAAQQQGQEPGPEMILAQGEYMKGQAALMKEQREATTSGIELQLEDEKLDIMAYGEETKRKIAEIKAYEAGVNIQNKRIDAYGKQIDNTAKIKQMIMPERQSQPQQ